MNPYSTLKMTIEEIEDLKLTNYVRKATATTKFWCDYTQQKMNKYKSKFGSEFNLVIYSELDIEYDYYIIPFSVVENLFQDKFLSNDDRRRWVVNITNHNFKVTNSSVALDIKEYYANPFLGKKIEENDDANEYEIENKRQEVNVRLKQSKFRKDVLKNFNNSCCITNISEEDLLVASHIIPWASKKNTRLDPANGLCLSILYDKLFDKGYFTLTNELMILTAQDTTNFSKSLVEILSNLNTKKIIEPVKPIQKEYLKYHRENIFIERERFLI
jgi:putative restriction endonuclease